MTEQSDGYETDFGILTFTTQELQTLGESERNFLLASSFIRNDIRFYWSLLMRSPTDETDEDVRVMQLIRWLWGSRKLASVIYEADVAVTDLIGKLPLAKEVAQRSPPISKAARKSPMYDVARSLRNKTAYHYDTADLGRALAEFSQDTRHRLFEHDQQGNGMSEIGEQIFTLPLLSKGGHTSSNEMFDNWIKECSGSMMRFCGTVIGEIFTQSFPDKTVQMRVLRIKSEAQPGEYRWPLFLLRDLLPSD